MALIRHCCACLLAGFSFGLVATAQELPKKSGPEDLEAEAKSLIDDLPMLQKEAEADANIEEPAPNEDLEGAVKRTQTALERVRKKQARWEKLARQGVLSRAEAESCVTEVANAAAKHERARVALMRFQLTKLQERVAKGEADQTLMEAADAALKSALESSSTAEKQARQARLDFARNTLDRHKKLFASGLVSRMQLQRAEANLRKIETDGQDPKSIE